ncbi:MAG TPA: hypothetical protein VN345_00120, partial [Blastocatellia bacterium]|nr:hypothetical protein [Blastocatellia bacterium]
RDAGSSAPAFPVLYATGRLEACGPRGPVRFLHGFYATDARWKRALPGNAWEVPPGLLGIFNNSSSG